MDTVVMLLILKSNMTRNQKNHQLENEACEANQDSRRCYEKYLHGVGEAAS